MEKSILNQFRLDGQAALVVGGNRGLGFEMAKAIAEAGGSIFIAARDEKRNAEARDCLYQQNARECAACVCDITDPQQVAATAAAAVEKFGKIDILFHYCPANAGVIFVNS